MRNKGLIDKTYINDQKKDKIILNPTNQINFCKYRKSMERLYQEVKKIDN